MYYSSTPTACLFQRRIGSIVEEVRGVKGMVEVGAARQTEANVKVEDRWAHYWRNPPQIKLTALAVFRIATFSLGHKISAPNFKGFKTS